ncbi:hypothetical protein SAXI111661_03590 [Saccharomonospora xinjiangensis]|uniref:Uncharacterized protein n=1 Tax=Saccharomonospora xinjiangensis XJ-54 TaxID=882086 RepID=I0UYK3_9PSEU|nr:hypothetical protein SacxiDRAFT_0687 [Saccharomonospora xinjiangensis XJ-54]QBQ59752.1 hypothetical protein EYD13_06930 [Saccharomonospora xinjiangensis]
MAGWWDGFELWLAQQWFPIQFVLVAAVLLPLCAGAAWVIHRGVDGIADRFAAPRGNATDDTRGDDDLGRSDAVS